MFLVLLFARNLGTARPLRLVWTENNKTLELFGGSVMNVGNLCNYLAMCGHCIVQFSMVTYLMRTNLFYMCYMLFVVCYCWSSVTEGGHKEPQNFWGVEWSLFAPNDVAYAYDVIFFLSDAIFISFVVHQC